MCVMTTPSPPDYCFVVTDSADRSVQIDFRTHDDAAQRYFDQVGKRLMPRRTADDYPGVGARPDA